jgi:hypothetical protein
MGKVYTRCSPDEKSLVKLCGPVGPLLANGLGYGLLSVLAVLTAGFFALGVAVASANPAAVAIVIAATAYVAGAAFYAGFFEGMCDQWLNGRLVCLPGPDVPDVEAVCAMGRAAENEKVNESFSNFDLDSFIELQLMPHLADDHTIVDPKDANGLFGDGFQGNLFLRRRLLSRPWSDEAGSYRWRLHCEFESDYWVRICQVSKVLAPFVPLLVALLSPAVEGLCNAVLGWLGPFAPVVCRFLAPLLAVLLIALLNLAIARLASDPGSASDFNVGDRPENPILMGEPVVVTGRFVYDAGHCDGWHEIHPVQKVMRVPPNQYLERNGNRLLLAPPLQNLKDTDMVAGLNSPAFRSEAMALKDRWCTQLANAKGPLATGEQASALERWTVHPCLDGCQEPAPEENIK